VQESAAVAARPGAAVPPPESERLSDVQSFLVDLLRFQCLLIGAVGGVVFLAGTPARRGGLAAKYLLGPEESAASRHAELSAALAAGGALVSRLERLAAEAVGPDPGHNGQARRSGVVESLSLPRPGGLYEAEPSYRALAFPLTAAGRAEGACILIVPSRQRLDADDALDRLALTCARFEAFLWKQQCLNEASQRARLRETLELLDASQQGATAEAMGALMCHELQRRFGCTRVSIGLVYRDRIRLTAVSGSDDLDRKGEAVGSIEDAMEECADQDIEVVFPPPPAAEADPAERRVTRAHEVLSRRFGPAAMLSLPLRVEGDLVGVVLLEREQADPFPAGSAPLLRLVAEFIGPALWTRRLADRGILAVVRDRTIDLGRAIVGPRHTGRKLAALVAILVLVGAVVIPIPSRIKAAAEVAAETSRTIPAPFMGYLATTTVRPGDSVAAGQVLATMDTSELELQLAGALAERQKLAAQLDEAQQAGELGKAKGFAAAVDQVTVDIDKTRLHLARSEIRSPIDGKVAQGDLDAFINAKVDPTQPLFVIVAEENTVELQVDERDINDVTMGQEGRLTIKALPGRPVGVRVTRINPMAEAIAGANIYRVEAELLDPAPWLKPGMTGTVRLDDGWTNGLSWMLDPLIDAARMKLWW
jgi:multidrug efflux pump subunit AcrA (membrane-fusion protein)